MAGYFNEANLKWTDFGRKMKEKTITDIHFMVYIAWIFLQCKQNGIDTKTLLFHMK